MRNPTTHGHSTMTVSGQDGEIFVDMLKTINAPYAEQIDAVTLARCFTNLHLAKHHSGQVSAFLGEVPVKLQVEFALAHGVAPYALEAFAIDRTGV